MFFANSNYFQKFIINKLDYLFFFVNQVDITYYSTVFRVVIVINNTQLVTGFSMKT